MWADVNGWSWTGINRGEKGQWWVNRGHVTHLKHRRWGPFSGSCCFARIKTRSCQMLWFIKEGYQCTLCMLINNLWGILWRYNPTHPSRACELCLVGPQWGEARGKPALESDTWTWIAVTWKVTHWLIWSFLISEMGDDDTYVIDLSGLTVKVTMTEN